MSVQHLADCQQIVTYRSSLKCTRLEFRRLFNKVGVRASTRAHVLVSTRTNIVGVLRSARARVLACTPTLFNSLQDCVRRRIATIYRPCSSCFRIPGQLSSAEGVLCYFCETVPVSLQIHPVPM